MDKESIIKKYKNVSDCDLIRKIKGISGRVTNKIKLEAAHALWYRYEGQTYKMKFALLNRIRENKSLQGIDTDSFFSGAYEIAFLKAVESIKIEKIVSPKEETKIRNKYFTENEIQKAMEDRRQKWKFYQGYQFYLQNYINRNIVGQYLKKSVKDIQMSSFTTENGEDYSENIKLSNLKYSMTTDDEFLQNENKKMFWSAVQNTIDKLTKKQKIIWELKENGEKKKDIAIKTKLTSSQINSELKFIKKLFYDEISKQEKLYKMKCEFVKH